MIVTVLSVWVLLSFVALLLVTAVCRSGHLEDEHWEALEVAHTGALSDG